MRKQQRGFSLIELLMVVAIILIIAAIAIPNLMSSRESANEASAVGTLRTLNMAIAAYKSGCSDIGFPATLVDLGPSAAGGCVGGANLVDDIIGVAAPQKSGYNFTYATPGTTGGAAGTSYDLHADPMTRGNTGQRSFYSSESGVITYNGSAAATATDAAVQ